MSEKSFLKIYPGSLPPEDRRLNSPSVRVRIGDVYRHLTLEEWRALPLWYPEAIAPKAVMAS